jgi:hypothetical protein
MRVPSTHLSRPGAGQDSHFCMLPLQAGAQRLSALANLSHSGASAAIDGDAIPNLLHLLEHSDDQGAIALQVLTPYVACCTFQPVHHLAVALR